MKESSLFIFHKENVVRRAARRLVIPRKTVLRPKLFSDTSCKLRCFFIWLVMTKKEKLEFSNLPVMEPVEVEEGEENGNPSAS